MSAAEDLVIEQLSEEAQRLASELKDTLLRVAFLETLVESHRLTLSVALTQLHAQEVRLKYYLYRELLDARTRARIRDLHNDQAALTHQHHSTTIHPQPQQHPTTHDQTAKTRPEKDHRCSSQ